MVVELLGFHMPHLNLRKTAAPLAAILLLGFSSTTWLAPALANSTTSLRQGFPGRRVGGGTRGNCPAMQGRLTALIPQTNLWITTSDQPKVFFYLPQTNTTQKVEFVLVDENVVEVYKTTFDISGEAGIVSVDLPTQLDGTALTADKNYFWSLSMICDPEDRSGDIVLEGWIRRIEPSIALSNQLQQASPLEQVELYQQADAWLDAMTAMVKLRRSQTSDPAVETNWKQLLEAIDLADLADAPLLEIDR